MRTDASPTNRDRADRWWSREGVVTVALVGGAFALASGLTTLTTGVARVVSASIPLVVGLAGSLFANRRVRAMSGGPPATGQDLAAVRSLRSEHLGRIAHLSHEIRTPLNSMLALSQLLRDGMAGELNPEQRKYVDVIERNGQTLIRMVSDVLDLARMESGRVTVELRSLDLADQLRATTVALAPLATVKGISIGVDPDVDALPLVRCDPERLRQVLTNLIGNAVKFTERGQVVVSGERRGDTVAVHVADTGIGISEAARPRVFEEFFQGGEPGRNLGDGCGVGLGLAIASRLVRLMGGELSVESAEGVGSRFTFTLPIGERVAVRGAGALAQHADGREIAPPSRKPAAPRPSRDEHHGPHTPD